MDDREFSLLQDALHKNIVEGNELQKLHRKETGRDYVISGPRPLSKRNDCSIMHSRLEDR